MSSEESNEMPEKKEAEEVTETDAKEPDEAPEAAPVQAESSAEEVASDQEAATDADERPADETQVETQAEEIEGEVEPEIQSAAEDMKPDSVDDEPFSEERIERILDIELPVNISFGSTKRPLSEVLKLGPGALLELDRAADEPVTLKVNNKVFAKGEIVDVDGYYGVQITEISSPVQRIASLGD